MTDHLHALTMHAKTGPCILGLARDQNSSGVISPLLIEELTRLLDWALFSAVNHWPGPLTRLAMSGRKMAKAPSAGFPLSLAAKSY